MRARARSLALHHSWPTVEGSHGANASEHAEDRPPAFGRTGLAVTNLDGTARGARLSNVERDRGAENVS